MTPEELHLAQARAMPEKGRGGLQEGVNALLEILNDHHRPTLYYHTHDSRNSAKGFPDCVWSMRPYEQMSFRYIVAELKNQRRKPTEEQILWLNDATLIPKAEVFLFRPLDYYNGTIQRVLWSPAQVECGATWCREHGCRLDEVEE